MNCGKNRRVLLSDSLFAFDRAFANVDTEMLPAMFLASELELRNVSLTVLRLPELDVVSTQRRAALDNMRRCEMTDVLFRCPLPTWLGFVLVYLLLSILISLALYFYLLLRHMIH